MAITEVFPHPTVKQVIFQIRFPNLFYVEGKIGDFQTRIMAEFPQSKMIFPQQKVIIDRGEAGAVEYGPIDKDEEARMKIWQFRSEKQVELNVTSSSLDINSKYHKTYKLGNADRFRDVIEFALSNFFEVTRVPIINRIGLRYIDECPVPAMDNDSFRSYYNTVLPLDRFGLDSVREMVLVAEINRGDYNIRYIEALRPTINPKQLILDFDGYADNIQPNQCMEVADTLHDLLLVEYEKTIREPVYEYMRRAEGDPL
ncbi:MAG: TIGR04255 family protein [candidate division Zixibacteria bacterium]|nr:TIGR04255 family protein [candidate division Zixibacteria bacterium]